MRAVTGFVLVAVLAVFAGCRAQQRVGVSHTGSPVFDEFRAEYRFAQPGELLGRSFSTDTDSLTGRAVMPVSWESGYAEAILLIECPHPSGDASLARATVSLQPDPTSVVSGGSETRVMALPRSCIELLIVDLARSGFFDAQQRSDVAGSAVERTSLSVRIDRGHTRREWQTDERLLDIAHRTLTEGR